VIGSHHTYVEGAYSVAVTISHEGAPTATAHEVAFINEVPVVATGGQSFTIDEGGTVSGMVATFSDAAGAEPPGHYTATIDWGDRNTAQNVAITAYGVVSGSHTYSEESAAEHVSGGAYTIHVTVHHSGTDSNTVASSATVN